MKEKLVKIYYGENEKEIKQLFKNGKLVKVVE